MDKEKLDESSENETEVEVKFQPTEEQLKKLLEGAIFVHEKENHDIYYDFNDYRLTKQDVRLRFRNGFPQLKVGKERGVADEIKNEEDIKKYFKTDLDLKDYIYKNMTVFIEYKVKRKEYEKEGFTIDLDDCNFGYKLCEIEKIVKDKSEISKIKKEILDFAFKNGIEYRKISSKRDEYLRKMRPEVYKELNGKKMEDEEKFKDQWPAGIH